MATPNPAVGWGWYQRGYYWWGLRGESQALRRQGGTGLVGVGGGGGGTAPGLESLASPWVKGGVEREGTEWEGGGGADTLCPAVGNQVGGIGSATPLECWEGAGPMELGLGGGSGVIPPFVQ